MKSTIFISLLFLASSGLAFPSETLTKGLPPLTRGLTPLTKGLPPPPSTQTKGLPPPPPSTQTKGLPASVLPSQFTDALTAKLSSACLAAVFSILVNPDFLKCMPITALVPLLPIVIDPSIIANFLKDPSEKTYKPIEQPLIKFSDGICAAPKCSDDLMQTVIKTLSDGCKEDIGKNDPLIATAISVAIFYSPIHDSICFKNPKKQYCWDETTLTVIDLPKSPIRIIDGGIIDSVAVADPFKVCTPCNRAIINTFGNFLKKHGKEPPVAGVLTSLKIDVNLLKVGVAVKCGIDFEDGNVGDPGKS